jgi:hypothetical protein
MIRNRASQSLRRRLEGKRDQAAKDKAWSALFPRLSIPLSGRKANATTEGGAEKRHSYNPLPTQFRREGFDYRQIYREGDFAIYRQTWSGCSDPSVSYEVIRIRRRDGFQIGGRFVEPAEVYPNSQAWGVDGWTVPDKEAAFHKLREIIASSNAPTRFGQKRNQSRLEKSPT